MSLLNVQGRAQTEHEWYGPERHKIISWDPIYKATRATLEVDLDLELPEDYEHLAIDVVNVVVDALLASTEREETGYEWIDVTGSTSR